MPRPARAESGDSALEERLERLEKMVESLLARKDVPQSPYPLKKPADAIGPMYRKQIAEIEAHPRHQLEIARKHELDAKEMEKMKEQAMREAARSFDLSKRAAVDAEKVAREQKRQTRRVFKEGSKKHLDELRKQLEILDRKREELDRQIEELERQQEQSDEQRDEDQESDARSDTSEFNSDSTQLPRK